jgi:hypothetical protein
MMATKGKMMRRLLCIDMASRTLTRLDPAKRDRGKARSMRDSKMRIEQHATDPSRLKITVASAAEDEEEEVKEYSFSGPAARARFMGMIAALEMNVDASKVRVLGIEHAGYSAPALNLFIGTLNTGDARPPTDVVALAQWIPPQKVCVAAACWSGPSPSPVRFLFLLCAVVGAVADAILCNCGIALCSSTCTSLGCKSAPQRTSGSGR